MSNHRVLLVAIVTIAGLASCGRTAPADEPAVADPAARVPAAPEEATVADVPSPEAEAAPPTTASLARPDAAPRSERQTVQLDQPAMWPGSDVVLDTPEQAAESFVAEVLGVEPVLGEFLAGDSRSGEIQVFSPGEVEGADLLERGRLGLRMIGPDDGWFVIAAASEGVAIDAPEALGRVAAGPVEVSGRGRGFEGTLVVTAFRAGDADGVLDEVIARGGPFEALEPFSVTLDLSAATEGDVVAIVVRGDTGLEGDPGDFAGLPVVIAASLPATR